jgi:integrase
MMSEQQPSKRSRKRRGRGEGSVFQRADGTWAGSVSLGYDQAGKRKRVTVYGVTKLEAQTKLRNVQTDHALGRLTDTNRFSVSDWLSLWLENTARLKVSPATYQRYKQVVERQIRPHLGTMLLSKLTPFHIVQFYASMEKAGESAATQRMAGLLLGNILRCAVKMNFLVRDVSGDVTRPKVAARERRAFTPDQARRFLQAAQVDRLYALYVLALDSGMRWGELAALQWPDIDFAEGALQVQRSLEELCGRVRLKTPKTKRSRRRIELSRFTLEVLNEHRRRMLAEGRDVKNGSVFCNGAGKYLRKSNTRLNSFLKIFARANQQAEEEARLTGTAPEQVPVIRFHDLRHTSATLLLQAGENIKVVSERLGHEDIQITLKTYAHVLPTMQKGAAARMDRLFRAPIGSAPGAEVAAIQA